MTLTAVEQAFISRMVDQIVRNPSLSMDDAARAVLARDNELVAMIEERRKTHSYAGQRGASIADGMAEVVYNAINAAT